MEFVLTHVYGDRITSEITADPNRPITVTDQTNSSMLSIRSSSVLRYDIARPISVFGAITIKSQPYPSNNSEIHDEVAYGAYCGCDIQYLNLSFVPYVTVPLGSAISHYRSPIAAGMQVSFRLTEENKRQQLKNPCPQMTFTPK